MVVISIKNSFLEFQPEVLAPPNGSARSCSAPPLRASYAHVFGDAYPREDNTTQAQTPCSLNKGDEFPSNSGRTHQKRQQKRQRKTKREPHHGSDEQMEQNTLHDANHQSDNTQIPKKGSRGDGTMQANRCVAQAQADCAAKDCATLPSCETAQPRKMRRRPCKAQRHKFHEFLERVKQETLRDPNLQLDSIQIPKAYCTDERALQKIVCVWSGCKNP